MKYDHYVPRVEIRSDLDYIFFIDSALYRALNGSKVRVENIPGVYDFARGVEWIRINFKHVKETHDFGYRNYGSEWFLRHIV